MDQVCWGLGGFLKRVGHRIFLTFRKGWPNDPFKDLKKELKSEEDGWFCDRQHPSFGSYCGFLISSRPHNTFLH